MDLSHIRQKIIELQKGNGMDPAMVLFLALAAAVVVSVIAVLLCDGIIRRRRQNPKPGPVRRHARSAP